MRSPKCIFPHRKQTKRPQNRKMDVRISRPVGSPSSQHAYSFEPGSRQDSTQGIMTGAHGSGQRGRDKIPTSHARRGREDPQPHPAPRDSDSGLTVAASSSSLLGQVLSPRLTPSPFSGFIHIAHTLPAFLTFTAGWDVHCLGLYLALEPLTPIHKPQGSSSEAPPYCPSMPLPVRRPR